MKRNRAQKSNKNPTAFFLLLKLLSALIIVESVSIDNEYDYENEILPLTIMRMRFAQNTCSTRSGNSFHDDISSKTRSARNELLKGKVYLL